MEALNAERDIYIISIHCQSISYIYYLHFEFWELTNEFKWIYTMVMPYSRWNVQLVIYMQKRIKKSDRFCLRIWMNMHRKHNFSLFHLLLLLFWEWKTLSIRQIQAVGWATWIESQIAIECECLLNLNYIFKMSTSKRLLREMVVIQSHYSQISE